MQLHLRCWSKVSPTHDLSVAFYAQSTAKAAMPTPVRWWKFSRILWSRWATMKSCKALTWHSDSWTRVKRRKLHAIHALPTVRLVLRRRTYRRVRQLYTRLSWRKLKRRRISRRNRTMREKRLAIRNASVETSSSSGKSSTRQSICIDVRWSISMRRRAAYRSRPVGWD